MRTTIRSLVTPLVLLCFGLLPRAQAVVPPPDGGYPNFTTAEGQNALFSLTTGAANTAVGWFSLKSVTTGSFNTGVGAGTLVLNTGDENTAVGTAALLLNTASGNTAVGSRALLNNTTGGTLGNIQGVDVGPNVAVGQQALESNTVTSANTAVGYQALRSFTTGPVGFEQVGLCTAVGFQALANITGPGDAFANNGFGYKALFNLTEGINNVAIGTQALLASTTAGGNVALGNGAGIDITTGNSNICIGNGAGLIITTANNVIAIGTNIAAANVDNSCYVGNIWTQPGGSQAVFVNADGKLGAQVSSRRFKEQIKPLDQASEALFALKPVSFRYKKEIDSTAGAQFGLLAEDVEKVNPDLVIRDKEGKPYSVRYDQVNAMLLNEFLKEHRTVQNQQKEIDALKAELDEQRSLLQRVAEKVELNRPTPQLVENSQ
jgi:trimeric autotransporter adhesin